MKWSLILKICFNLSDEILKKKMQQAKQKKVFLLMPIFYGNVRNVESRCQIAPFYVLFFVIIYNKILLCLIVFL